MKATLPGKDKGKAPDMASALKPLHGMTANQIIEKAKKDFANFTEKKKKLLGQRLPF